MSEYWKSTPKYWCKFCEIYVRDTGIERRNHEASGKHQGAIQRSLQKVHKGKQREEWEQQRAKNEVARLNGLVGQSKQGSSTSQSSKQLSTAANPPRVSAPAAPIGDLTAQRRSTAEQWLAMGVALPKELQQEVTGTGEWRTVSERVVKLVPKLNEIAPPTTLPQIKGVHKRKAEEDDDENEGKADAPRAKKAWGSRFKSFGNNNGDGDAGDQDLDALLNNVTKKPGVKSEDSQGSAPIKTEDGAVAKAEDSGSVKREDATDPADCPEVKQEEGESVVTAPPVVSFKKRKAKR